MVPFIGMTSYSFCMPHHLISQIQFSIETLDFVYLNFPIYSHFLGIIKFLLIVCIDIVFGDTSTIQLNVFHLYFRLIRTHLFGLLSLLFLTFSAASFLDRFGLLFKNNEILFGYLILTFIITLK